MTLPKIEEWIKEVEQRPGSALTILKLIAGRLRDLTERNEELLAENIALQDGSRVEEYRKRIAAPGIPARPAQAPVWPEPGGTGGPGGRTAAVPLCLLVYNALGRILRIEPVPETGASGHLSGELSAGGEAPRLLALPANEELLLLFSSGRVSTCPVEDIPVQPAAATGTWSRPPCRTSRMPANAWPVSCRFPGWPWRISSCKPAGAAASKRP